MNPVNLNYLFKSLKTQKGLGGLKWLCCFGLVSTQLFYSSKINAQLIPDNTLGAENSIVNPQDVRDFIEGGARRGSNLFHSFLEFNVGSQQQVYFANPLGVDNILTRVTGNNLSRIFGTLGVEGTANLFLINPNGIIFGAGARLDVAGSFIASTADAIKLGEEGLFSATEPQKSALLTIQPGVLFFNQLARQPATITNAGHLSVGGNLILAADTLNLQGQLIAGENLTLQASDKVQIRDSFTSPFIAHADRNLLVQGSREIDIFALNHPDSGLFSGGEMMLRSGNTVQGDAHFWSGGNFHIEQLNGSLGSLLSPSDPIIRSSGDVLIGAYQGASLHIFAGGSVTIPGGVAILAPDPINGIVENVTLSDGTSVSIDGTTQPTLDIRAGMLAFNNPVIEGIPSAGIIAPPLPNPLTSPTSADITIGGILNPGGVVFLTNQYQPNPLLTGGITVDSINTKGVLAGGNVIIHSKGFINSTAGTIDSSSLGQAGDILLRAVGNLSVGGIDANGQSSGSISLNSGATLAIDNSIIRSITGSGAGGDIELSAQSLTLSGGSRILSFTGGSGQGGNIQITAESISASDNSDINAGAEVSGAGGNIWVTAESITLKDQSDIGTITFSNGGKGGNLIINASELVQLLNGGSLAAITSGSGDAGDLTLNTRQLIIKNTIAGSELETGVSTAALLDRSGDAGNLTINASSGDAGNLTINAESIEIMGNQPGAAVAPTDLATLSDLAKIRTGLTSGTQGSGDAGNLTINTDHLIVRDGAGISTSADFTSTGKGGNLRVNATQVELRGRGGITTLTLGSGDTRAGDLYVNAEQVTLLDGAVIGTGSLSGNGGNILLEVADVVLMRNNSLITTTAGQAGKGGDGGDIDINTQFLVAVPEENSDITANAFEGNGGNINITAQSIIGLQVSDDLTPNSDITVSSQLGIDGTIAINTPSVDPSQGLTKLPSNFTDSSNQIVAGCPADKGNSFTVTGRGGIPENPSQYLRGRAVWTDRRNLSAVNPETQPTPYTRSDFVVSAQSNADTHGGSPHSIPHTPLQEAQGWIVDENGTVTLTAAPSRETPLSSGMIPSCQSSY